MNEELTAKEYALINAVMDGDEKKVYKLLPYCDLQKIGVLALRQSLGWEDLIIARLLLDSGAPAHETLLQSVHDGVMFEVNHLLSLKEFTLKEMVQACAIGIIKDRKEVLEVLTNKCPQVTEYRKYLLGVAHKENPKIVTDMIEFLEDLIAKKKGTQTVSSETYLEQVHKTAYKH